MECVKCGEFITEYELSFNDNLCPCCGSDLAPYIIHKAALVDAGLAS